MKKMVIRGTGRYLPERVVTNADLSKTNFNDCNLKDAVCENTILEGSDFSTAYNFNLNPDKNKMKGAKFSRATIDGLLLVHQIIIE
mgnify:CR=1 FL=1